MRLVNKNDFYHMYVFLCRIFEDFGNILNEFIKKSVAHLSCSIDGDMFYCQQLRASEILIQKKIKIEGLQKCSE